MIKRTFNILALTAGLLAIATGWAMITPYFSIRRIEFFGLQSIHANRGELRLPFKYGDNLLMPKTKYAEEYIMQDCRIENVKVVKHYPDGVEIYITEKTPSYLLNCGTIWGLTSAGDAIPVADVRKLASLPVISATSSYQPLPYRRVNEPSVQRALQLANKIERKNPSFLDRISEIISPREREYSIFLRSGIEVKLPDGDEKLLDRLSIILRNLGSDMANAFQIDMRFPEQGIVRFMQDNIKSKKNKGEG